MKFLVQFGSQVLKCCPERIDWAFNRIVPSLFMFSTQMAFPGGAVPAFVGRTRSSVPQLQFTLAGRRRTGESFDCFCYYVVLRSEYNNLLFIISLN